MEDLGRSLPSSVQITACERAPVISIDDPINIDHRNHFKHEIVPQDLSLRVIRICQKIQDSFHHPGSNRFSWVSPRSNNCSLLLDFTILRSNSQVVAFIPCKGGTEVSDNTEFGFLWVPLNGLEVVLQLCVGVRVTIGEIDFILIILKIVLKGQSVVTLVILEVLSSDTIGIIGDVRCSSEPPYILLLSSLFRID